MKKFKLLSSIVAAVAISCVAAASSMAADAIEIKMDAANSTANSKVFNIYYTGTALETVNQISQVQVDLPGVAAANISATTKFESPTITPAAGKLTIKSAATEGQAFALENGSCLLATVTVAGADDVTASVSKFAIAGYSNAATKTTFTVKTTNASGDSLTAVNAADLGTFTDGEGDPAKAYKADAAVEGAITWYVTDGTNVASKAVTEVTGGAEVVVGLVATGANAGNINYAAVTID